MTEKLITPEARLSYPALFTPKAGMDGGAEKYSCALLFPKATDLSALKAAAAAAVKAKWGDKKPAGLRSPFRDGDEKEQDGYRGCIFVNVSSKMKPGVIGPDKQPITSERDIYGGCYVRASLTCYAYDQKGNRGVAFGLKNIQKLRDGEPFGNFSNAEDDFDAVEGAAAAAERHANNGTGGKTDDIDIF